MLDANSQLALSLFAIAAVCVLVIARAGQFFGAPGATFAVLILWVVLSTVTYIESRELIISGFVTSIPLIFFILLPMLLTANGHSLRGRLLVGLAGAGLYAWLVTPNVISM